MDARNYIDSLIHSESTGEATRRYDFIYADAFNHHSVPYQLTTKEFNDSVAELLKPDGVYMINLIDIFSGGEFLGPYFATLEQTFDHVVVIDEEGPDTTRKTFVLVASKKSLNLHGLNTEAPAQDLRIRVFSEKRKKALREKAGGHPSDRRLCAGGQPPGARCASSRRGCMDGDDRGGGQRLL